MAARELPPRRHTAVIDVKARAFDLWTRSRKCPDEIDVEEALTRVAGQRNDVDNDFVIRALLRRTDLPDEVVMRVVAEALTWLDRYGNSIEAQYTLSALLEREDLAGSEAKRTAAFALPWLERHVDEREASFVLRPLLARRDLSKTDSRRLAAAALAWLEQHGATPYADRVFNALLRARHVSYDQMLRVGAIAVSWLKTPMPEREDERYHAIIGLLLRAPKLTDNIVRGVVDETCRWLPDADIPPEVRASILFKLTKVAGRCERVAQVRALVERAPAGTVVPKLPRNAFRRLAEELSARARDRSAPVDVVALRRAVAETQRQHQQGGPSLALPAIPALLPLAARAGNEAIVADAVQMAADVLDDVELEPPQVLAALRGCRDLLDAWPDRSEGERILALIAPPGITPGPP